MKPVEERPELADMLAKVRANDPNGYACLTDGSCDDVSSADLIASLPISYKVETERLGSVDRYRWQYGEWSGTVEFPADERGLVVFVWDQIDQPDNWEDIEAAVLEVAR